MGNDPRVVFSVSCVRYRIVRRVVTISRWVSVRGKVSWAWYGDECEGQLTFLLLTTRKIISDGRSRNVKLFGMDGRIEFPNYFARLFFETRSNLSQASNHAKLIHLVRYKDQRKSGDILEGMKNAPM